MTYKYIKKDRDCKILIGDTLAGLAALVVDHFFDTKNKNNKVSGNKPSYKTNAVAGRQYTDLEDAVSFYDTKEDKYF